MTLSRKTILTSLLFLLGIQLYGQDKLSLNANLEDTIKHTDWSYEELRVIIHPSWKGFPFFESESDTKNKVGKSFENLPITLSIKKVSDKYFIKCEHSFCLGPDTLPAWYKELSKQDLILIDEFLQILINCPYDMTIPTFAPDMETFWYKESAWKINPDYNIDFPTHKCKDLSFYPLFQQIFSNEIESLIRKREEFRSDFNKKFFGKWYYNPALILDPADGLTVTLSTIENKTDSACLTLTKEHRIIFTSSLYSMNSNCNFLLFYDSYNFGYFPYFGLLDHSLYQEIFGKDNTRYAYIEVLSLTTDEMTLRFTYK